MKKVSMCISILFLLLGIGITQVSANSIDFDDEQLNKKFEKVLESIPDGEYSFESDSNISTQATKNQYKPRAEDILYTPSTQCKNDKNICKRISGHVGIVHSNGSSVIHTAGKNSKPKVISKDTWFKNYKKNCYQTKQLHNRKKSFNLGKNYYGPGRKGANKSYKVTFENNLRESLKTKTTYCSLIVWQAYYFGANQYLSVGDPIPPKAFVTFASYHKMTNHMKIGY